MYLGDQEKEPTHSLIVNHLSYIQEGLPSNLIQEEIPS